MPGDCNFYFFSRCIFPLGEQLLQNELEITVV